MMLPKLYTVGRDVMEQTEAPTDMDPRGLVLVSEPPNPRATYMMGIDPTVGLVGWNRHKRTRDDFRTDNGAIEIVKLGTAGKPDIQVCEYAAPIDPEDLAEVANILGRMYSGNDESGQCECVIEVYPGPGLLTQRKMMDHLGYSNMWRWQYLDGSTVRATNSFGWQSSPKSVRDLWIRGTRHITRAQVKILSPYLAEELAYCEPDERKMTAKATSGKHDDRVRAFLMAIWALHDWNYQVEDTPSIVTEGKVADWQASDVSVEKMWEKWEERWNELSEEAEGRI